MKHLLTGPALLLAISPALASAQGAAAAAARAESVTVVAGPEYRASGVHTFFFGKGYRDLWTTPYRVPVLDLRTYEGGLKPEKVGGGMQTISLHLKAKDGTEFVYRSVNKRVHVPGKGSLKGALVEDFFRDQISATHPAAAMVVAPLMEAAGLMHATPVLYMMPKDSVLGKFDSLFAGRLGMLELWTGKKKKRAGFENAAEVVNADSLLKRLNADPAERVDGREMLAARLMDMMVNDIDRHPGNWKWARMEPGTANPWLPIPRDRDQAFISYGGLFVSAARLMAPNLVPFDGNYNIAGLTHNSLALDRRLLSGLEKPVWDSVAADLVRRISNPVIDSAVEMMPREYLYSAPQLAATLKLRRDHLPAAANTFYRLLAGVVDVHATDAADRLTVTRLDDRRVEVRLQSGKDAPYFLRRFDAAETREVRVYLHGGADTVVVAGDVARALPVRVIGGRGTTWLADPSATDGQHPLRAPVRLPFTATAADVSYGPDTLFDRRPWVKDHGVLVPPPPDHGTKLEPVVSISAHRGLGLTPRVGVNRVQYGFGTQPYASLVGLDAAYALGLPGFRVEVIADKRWEGSPLHLMGLARVSQFEVLSYHGLGNDSPDSASKFFDVAQRQWLFTGGPALSLVPGVELSLGPFIQYSVTDSAPGRFLSSTRPYGFGHFGQAGLQVGLHHDVKIPADRAPWRVKFDLTGTAFPAVWDVKRPYQKLSLRAGSSYTFPMPLAPTLVLRGGGDKLYGDFPFDQAAFIGGNHTLRRVDPQRYAGDASLYGNSELRIPVASFAVIVPLQAGILGTAEAGRVYVGGKSPGGWHTAMGGGLFVGRADQSFLVSCTLTSEPLHKGVHCQTGLSF
ncbi:MAG TPA: hypothetical protein VHE78_16140 [Gemmatimonadaceae bacterium]|nr:hypothetical protein [Gemmatimonadaceae bacterium]